VLVVDQFEKSLQRPADQQSATFLNLLRRPVDSEDPTMVILATMRSDFLETLQKEKALIGINFRCPTAKPYFDRRNPSRISWIHDSWCRGLMAQWMSATRPYF
jgi:hypothetical protein